MHDYVIRNGLVYDGLGGEPYEADIAFSGKFRVCFFPLYLSSSDKATNFPLIIIQADVSCPP